MAIRVHLPDRLATAEAGRVHLTRYPETITLDIAQMAQDDYVQFTREQGGATPLLMISERPFPVPSLEVRAHWREVAKQEPGFEAIALVLGGVVGLMAAAATHLGEQLVAVLGVRFRSFKQPFDAADWLCEIVECGVDPDVLLEAARELRSIDQ